MSDAKPEPSDCPLCGSKCENGEDGDDYAIVVCTSSNAKKVFRGGGWVPEVSCPYMVYQDCHEAICTKVRGEKG